MKNLILAFLIFLLPLTAAGQAIPQRTAAAIDSMMIAGLQKGYYPGASILIGNRNGVLFEKYYGYHDASRSQPVGPEDIFDLASLTKVVSTTFAVMRLQDRYRLDVDKRIGEYINDYDGTPVENIRLSELLTHTSGLPYFPAYTLLFSAPDDQPLTRRARSADYPTLVDKNTYLYKNPIADRELVSLFPRAGYRQAGPLLFINPEVDRVITEKVIDTYNPDLRGRYRYSDTNFLILRQIIEALTGQALDVFTAGLFGELEMFHTGYNPLEWKSPRDILPTEDDKLLGRGQLRGFVHDDLAAANGGVEGNAGLFSNVSDLSNFCRMLMSEGKFNGRTVIDPATVRQYISSPLRSRGIYRGLGFDKRDPSSPLYDGYGHTGYTGTMLWIDQQKGIYMVFLSNRVYPNRLNNGLINSQLRVKIWELLKDI